VQVTGPGGVPVAGATVKVRVSVSGEQPRIVTVTTDSSGRAVVEVGPYNWWEVLWAQVEVVSVEGSGVSWDGASASTAIVVPRG
jgi:hypothetical protein